MNKRLIFLIIFVVLIAGITVIIFLPKQYAVVERDGSSFAAWKGDDLLFFNSSVKMGRSQNPVARMLEKHAPQLRLVLMMTGGFDGMGSEAIGYHVSADHVEKLALPTDFSRCQWTAFRGALICNSFEKQGPWKWDGEKFAAVTAAERADMDRDIAQQRAKATVKPDDERSDDEDGDAESAYDPRRALKEAGWHFKYFYGFSDTKETVLPISLTHAGSLSLTRQISPGRVVTNDESDEEKASIDPWEMGSSGAIVLSGEQLAGSPYVLVPARDAKWKPVDKATYESMMRNSNGHRRRAASNFTYIWLLLVLSMGFRFMPWLFHFPLMLFKRKRIMNPATSFSFPPALPEQFPLLSKAALEQHTREFESLGFQRIGDFTLLMIGGNSQNIPSYIRLFSHPGKQCFGEISQVFPPRTSQPLRCAVCGELEQDWNIAFSNTPSSPASVFVRIPRSIGRSQPGATVQMLFDSFLNFRNEVCMNLGIRSTRNATLDDFVQRMQRDVTTRAQVMRERQYAPALLRYYWRKNFAAPKATSEWLGDYPKEAEQRKKQFGAAATL